MVDPEVSQNIPEIEGYKDQYRAAFYDVAVGRGIGPDALAGINQAGCIPLLEAELDESDGAIELPPEITSFIGEMYPGASLLVSGIVLYDEGGVIEVGLEGLKNGWEQDEEFLTAPIVPELGKTPQYYRQSFFDLSVGIASTGRRFAGEPFFVETQDGQIIDNEDWEEKSIPADVLDAFAKLPGIIDEREDGKLSVYRKSNDMMSPLSE